MSEFTFKTLPAVALHDELSCGDRRHVSTSISLPKAIVGAIKLAHSSLPHAPFFEKNVKLAPPLLAKESIVGVAVTRRVPLTKAVKLGSSGRSASGTKESYVSGSARLSALATASTPEMGSETQRKLCP